jgi:hypothetical protein
VKQITMLFYLFLLNCLLVKYIGANISIKIKTRGLPALAGGEMVFRLNPNRLLGDFDGLRNRAG